MNTPNIKQIKWFNQKHTKGGGIYYYMFDTPCGIVEWMILKRDDEEIENGALPWVAGAGGEESVGNDDVGFDTKREAVEFMVKETLDAVKYDRLFLQDTPSDVYPNRINLRRYMEQHDI